MASRLAVGAAYGMLCFIWGSTWLAIKIGLAGAPAFFGAALRFVVAAITLLALAAVFRSRVPRSRAEWALIAYVGVVLFTLDYGLIYWGEAAGVESGLSAILFATFPFQTALTAHAILPDERLTAQKVAGTILGFAGILIIFRGQLGAAGFDLALPMVAIVLAATCAATASVAVKRWGHDADPISFNAFAMGIGAVGLTALSLLAAEPWSVPGWPEGIVAIVYLGLAGSVVTFVTYLWLLKRLEATQLSYIAFVTPIVAVFLGYAVATEVLDPLVLVGAAVTLAGIYLSISTRATAWLRGFVGAPVGEPRAIDPPDRRS
ncbi:MAG: EamA family transporter [Euryarchaeota archaeon]|nr:EamA family transporter [Euryarchaeota archaeon]